MLPSGALTSACSGLAMSGPSLVSCVGESLKRISFAVSCE